MRDYKFGNFLTSLRKQCGYTQYELGKLLGVSDKAVSKWENGTAKPSIDILMNLSNLLNISIEELLTCSHNEDNNDLENLKNTLFSNVEKKLKEKYGENLPIEVWNLYLLERQEINKIPLLCKMLNDLANIYEIINNLSIDVIFNMNISASLIVNTLGISNANPLIPHYYCPNCKTIIFKNECKDALDLKTKTCSCGHQFKTDGHNIPFETYKNNFSNIALYSLMASKQNINALKQIIKKYFEKQHFVVTLDGKMDDKIVSEIKICFHKPKEILQQICYDLSYEDFHKENNNNKTSYIQTLHECETILIEENTFLQEINVNIKAKGTKKILFNIENQDFKNRFFKDLIKIVNPQTYYEIIKLINISFSDYDNDYLVDLINELEEGKITFDEIFTCREDVFSSLIDKFKPTNANAIVNFITTKIKQGKSKQAEREMLKININNFEEHFQDINIFSRIKYLVYKAISIQVLNYLLDN